MILYTDGSCSPNPGPGGWAVVMNGEPIALGSDDDTTNIRMEGLALLFAMQYAKSDNVIIKTDSQFWIDVLTRWARDWKAKNWHRVKNLDLVKQLHKLYNPNTMYLQYTKAHVGEPGNELADRWANRARRLGVKSLEDYLNLSLQNV